MMTLEKIGGNQNGRRVRTEEGRPAAAGPFRHGHMVTHCPSPWTAEPGTWSYQHRLQVTEL